MSDPPESDSNPKPTPEQRSNPSLHPTTPRLNASTDLSLPSTRKANRANIDDELDPRILELVEEYYEQLASGTAPPIEEFANQHPDFATELRECLEGLQLVHAGQPTDPLLGTQTPKQLGDFRIIREVGRGGMGIVYEAQQITLKRRVALKILRYAVADQEAMMRFQREAETVARLHHSNIVPIFAVGDQDGVHYFAMQFIEGQSLDQLQRDQQDSLDPTTVAEWAHQVAEALAYAHENDIIHRDVKPSNLIRDQQGRIWLTDFGLAKRLDDLRLSMTGTVLGTPRYMSPEQASSVSQPVDHRTDIYSLGATLYELVTGQPLFDAKSPHAALGQIVSTEPTPPRAIRSSVPKDLETIILRCLSKDAGDRYDTAQQLASDLLAFAEGRPIKARRPGWVERLGRWLQKNQRSVSIAATAAGLVAAAIFGSWYAVTRYHESQLGRIRFDTNEMYSAPMVAELLKDDGSKVVPSFTIPTQHAIEIPTGDYHLRLSVDGEPSDTSQLAVYPQRGSGLVNVELPNRDVWPHLDIDGPWQLVQVDGGADVLVYNREGLVCYDGKTSAELWRTNLREHKQLTQQLQQAGLAWKWKIDQNQKATGADQFAPATTTAANADWNSDGHNDLLLKMVKTPVLMAISGKDGELLWSAVVAPKIPYETVSRTLGEPLFVDVDEDGVLDVVTHHIDVEMSRGKDRVSYIVATAGASGERLWRYEFDSAQLGTTKELPLAPSSVQWRGRGRRNNFESWNETGLNDILIRWGSRSVSMSPNFIVPHQPILVQHEDRNEIAIAAGDKLLQLNVRTGKPIQWQTLNLVPVCPPQPIDIDGDGQLELLLCEQQTGRVVNGVFQKGSFLRATCWRIPNMEQAESPIWEHTVRADWNWLLPYSDSRQAWPLLEDLDGDGLDEIIMPGDSTIDAHNSRDVPGGNLQVLDASNGQPKWLNADKVIHADGQINYFVSTPDFNADGVRDLTTVTLFESKSTRLIGDDSRGAYLHIDILSGADGTRLTWIRSSRVTVPLSDLPFVQNILLSDDLLLVELQTNLRRSRTGHVCLFSLSSGREIIASHRIEHCRLADINGDDQEELVSWIPKKQFPAAGGRLKAWSLIDWQGNAANSWSQTDQSLLSTSDMDGDGIGDIVGGANLNVDAAKRFVSTISGRTGKKLWQKSFYASNAIRLSPLTIDANNDGNHDLLVGHEHDRSHRKNAPLELWSGRTGQPLWRMKMDKPGAWSNERVFLEDLDNDGQQELLVLAQTAYGFDRSKSRNSQQPISLFCVNARNGTLRWHADVLDQNLGQASHLFDGYQLLSEDVNADGIRDVIGLGRDNQHGLALRTWDGLNGEQLWSNDAGHLPNNVSMLEREKYPSFVAIRNKTLCQIVSLNVANYASPTTRFDVIGMDALTGKQAWKWSIKADDVSEPEKTSLQQRIPHGVTTIAKYRTAEGERVGFWYKVLKEDRVEFVLLEISNDSATPVLTKTLSTNSDAIDNDRWHDDYLKSLAVAPIDVDGDGLDELIYTTPTHLVAFSLTDQRIVWEYPLEQISTRISSISKPDEPVEIVLSQGITSRWKHDQVVAINGDGQKTWTAHTPESITNDELHILQSSNPNVAPMVMLSNPKITYSSAGRIEGSTRQWNLRKLDATDVDIRTTKLLPHGPDRLAEGLAYSFVISSLLIGLPIFYIGRLLKGQWSLRLLMLAPLVTGIVIVVAQFPAPEQGVLTTVQFNWMLALSGLPLLMILRLIYDLAKAGAWRKLLLLPLAILGVGAIVFLVFVGVINLGTARGASEMRYVWTWRHGMAILGFGLGYVGMITTLGYFLRFVWRIRQGLSQRLFRRQGVVKA